MEKTGMDKVISYVNTHRGSGQKESLDQLALLLEELGNPQKDLAYIHITGTNGKGSSSAMLASVLREKGLNVGLFTSPHLEQVNERIRINDALIADEDFIRLVEAVEPTVLKLEEKLGEKFPAFDLLTTVAFLYFQEKQPDIVILEAGIGGRLDSTNIIDTPLVALVTSVGLDHMATLGDSKEAIAYEKAHVLKKNGQMVVGPVETSLQSLIEKYAETIQGEAIFIDAKDIQIIETTPDYQVFNYKALNNIKLKFLGPHQAENAALVIEVCHILNEKGWTISNEDIKRGLEKAYWPGRFEKMLDQPLFYIDGAHNVDGVSRLVETLETSFPDKTFYFIVGMMADKDYQMMINQVKHLAKAFILMTPDPARGFKASEVAETLKAEGYEAIIKESAAGVLNYIQEEIPKESTVIQFGSLYLVGAIKQLFH